MACRTADTLLQATSRQQVGGQLGMVTHSKDSGRLVSQGAAEDKQGAHACTRRLESRARARSRAGLPWHHTSPGDGPSCVRLTVADVNTQLRPAPHKVPPESTEMLVCSTAGEGRAAACFHLQLQGLWKAAEARSTAMDRLSEPEAAVDQALSSRMPLYGGARGANTGRTPAAGPAGLPVPL